MFQNPQGEDRQLRLFPDDDQVDLADDPDVVRISLIRIRKTIVAREDTDRADGPDLLRIQADSPPGLGRRVPQGLVIRVHSVGPVMRTQVMPQVLPGFNSGEYGSSPIRLTFCGTTSPPLTWYPALSHSSTACTPGSSRRENSARNRLTTAVFSSGMTSPTAAPLAAQTAVSTYSDSRPSWRTRRGREPGAPRPG